jgi:glycerophosphoryl diester phosphodiesterase
MELIGHRGCADQYPENTVHAVRRSSRYLDTIEVDVRRCRSGELVVFHDETVDRLTDATGRVADLDWATLRDLEVMGSGETVPRLSTVLEAFPDGIRAQVELKERGLAADVRDAVAASDVEVTVSSFDTVALAEVADLDWEVDTGFLFEADPDGNLATARDLGCAVVHPHYDLCLETDVVDRAHAAGLRVVAWKAARTAEEVQAVREAGVDGITADRWDIA